MKTAAEKWDEVFGHRYVPVTETGCFVFTGTWVKGGYANLRINKVYLYGHRVSYGIMKGAIPKGMYVCHKCDVRQCINPEHLFLGSAMDNVRDMQSKKRNVFGERQVNRKLNSDEALFIKNSDITGVALARYFLVSTAQVSLIKNGKAWSHL